MEKTDTALAQQVFSVPKRERKPDVDKYALLDDLG